MANKFWDGDKFMSIAAMFVSLCTLFVLIYEAQLMRDQQELFRKQQLMSVYPYLSFSNYGTGSSNYKFVLNNTGIGPAIIKSVNVYADGNIYEDIAFYIGDKFKDSINFGHSNIWEGRMISQGEMVEVIVVNDEKVSSGMQIVKAIFDFDTFIEITYESVYGETWIVSNRSTSPIKVCDTCTLAPQILGYKSESIIICPISDQSYIHISYLETESFGKVACNGYIYVDQGEAIVFDTPVTNEGSTELIQWVQSQLGAKIKAIVPGHFHEDCLGGLEAFHESGIASYANALTLQLAEEQGSTVPENGFEGKYVFKIGESEVVSTFLGEGHTKDNVVSYIPSEKLIFGGCLIKSMGAGKGNVADGNVNKWSNTVRKIKDEFPDVKYVIPGHGDPGGVELLDYTIELFDDK